MAFVATNELSNSLTNSAIGFVASAVAVLVLCSVVFNVPSDFDLPKQIATTEIDANALQTRSDAIKEQLRLALASLQQLSDEKRRQIESGDLLRQALLNRNWRAMRDDEWECFLEEVFRALGAKVQRTGKTGDLGVDLIAEFGDRRIAVQAKGYYHAVSGSAVQEAVAGVAHYRCNSSAVITNSRFTKGARTLAESNRCILIGEDQIPDLVLGKIAF